MTALQEISRPSQYQVPIPAKPITLRDALAMGAQVLTDASIPSAPLDARLLLLHATGYSNEAIILNPEQVLAENVLYQYLQLVARRASHEPIAYILQKKSFWSLDFHVTRDTLIPRPDSETLIELSLECIKDRSKLAHIVDLGTGSGCLLLSLLSELPQGNGTGIDSSAKALEVALRNTKDLGFEHRTTFIESNWCEKLDRKADIIISNPPYIAPDEMPQLQKSVAAYEPHSALCDGVDGLDAYRAIAGQAKHHLNPNGFCVVELGFGQAKAVRSLFQSEGWNVTTIKRDLAGVERALAATLNE